MKRIANLRGQHGRIANPTERGSDSDIDLLVVYDDEVGVSLLKHAAMIVDLETILNRPVDIVEDGTLLPFAVESANRDKKLIYERA